MMKLKNIRPANDQQQIMSSIFCNANRKDMNIEKRTINELLI